MFSARWVYCTRIYDGHWRSGSFLTLQKVASPAAGETLVRFPLLFDGDASDGPLRSLTFPRRFRRDNIASCVENESAEAAVFQDEDRLGKKCGQPGSADVRAAPSLPA